MKNLRAKEKQMTRKTKIYHEEYKILKSKDDSMITYIM